jgi:hypothetical protein
VSLVGRSCNVLEKLGPVVASLSGRSWANRACFLSLLQLAPQLSVLLNVKSDRLTPTSHGIS